MSKGYGRAGGDIKLGMKLPAQQLQNIIEKLWRDYEEKGKGIGGVQAKGLNPFSNALSY